MFSRAGIVKRYSFSVALTAFSAVYLLLAFFMQIDLFEGLINALSALEAFEADEVVLIIFLIVVGITIDMTRYQGLQRRRITLDRERIQTMRATMSTVHDVVNNGLNNLHLIRLEAEKSQALSPETLTLFETLISDTAVQLREIDQLESVTERTLGEGLASLESGPCVKNA
ncbi:hypothetical protein ACFL12_06415 [Pseudomonadota bacterium]